MGNKVIFFLFYIYILRGECDDKTDLKKSHRRLACMLRFIPSFLDLRTCIISTMFISLFLPPTQYTLDTHFSYEKGTIVIKIDNLYGIKRGERERSLFFK